MFVFVTIVCFSVNLHAADFAVGEDGIVILPESLVNVDQFGDNFYLSDGVENKILEVFVAEKDGNQALHLSCEGTFKAGSYILLRATDGVDNFEEMEVLAWDFQIMQPIVYAFKFDELESFQVIEIAGQYFGHDPLVEISYILDDQVIQESCTVIENSGLFDDPFDGSDIKKYMDVLTGESSLHIQLPFLPEGAENLVIEVKSEAGSGVSTTDSLDLDKKKPGTWLFQCGGFELTGRQYVKSVDIIPPIISHPGYFLKSFLSGSFLKRIVGQIAIKGLLADSSFQYFAGLFRHRNDIMVRGITYVTKDDQGNKTLASGLIVMPEKIKSDKIKVHIFNHGTMLTRNEAPTVSIGAEMATAMVFAVSNGHVVLIPDHLGLGYAANYIEKKRFKTNVLNLHPYCNARANAIGSGYILPAAKDYLKHMRPGDVKKIDFENPIIGGYSEGGYITLALCRELEQNPEYYGIKSVDACCPMAGPHSLSDVMSGKLTLYEKFPIQYFAPFLMVTMNKWYGNFYNKPEEYFAKGYTEIESLIDGKTSAGKINDLMPDSGIPREAFDSLLMDKVAARDMNNKLYQCIRENDLVPLWDIKDDERWWLPQAPTRMIHGDVDDCVPYSNSRKALDFFNQSAIKLSRTNNVTLDSVPASSSMDILHALDEQYHVLFFPKCAGRYWKWASNMFPSYADGWIEHR
jgi:pimeloyl-ACP methyl ester carboxylesterase